MVGHIGERPIVIVVIESAAAFLSFDRHFYRRRVSEVNVRPSIAVVVEQQNSAAHRFQNVSLLRRGAMGEVDAGLLRDVLQLRYSPVMTLDLFSRPAAAAPAWDVLPAPEEDATSGKTSAHLHSFLARVFIRSLDARRAGGRDEQCRRIRATTDCFPKTKGPARKVHGGDCIRQAFGARQIVL